MRGQDVLDPVIKRAVPRGHVRHDERVGDRGVEEETSEVKRDLP